MPSSQRVTASALLYETESADGQDSASIVCDLIITIRNHIMLNSSRWN